MRPALFRPERHSTMIWSWTLPNLDGSNYGMKNTLVMPNNTNPFFLGGVELKAHGWIRHRPTSSGLTCFATRRPTWGGVSAISGLGVVGWSTWQPAFFLAAAGHHTVWWDGPVYPHTGSLCSLGILDFGKLQTGWSWKILFQSKKGMALESLESGSGSISCIFSVLKAYQMDVSENRGTPKSSILIGFSIMNHPFWGTFILGTPQMNLQNPSRWKEQMASLEAMDLMLDLTQLMGEMRTSRSYMIYLLYINSSDIDISLCMFVYDVRRPDRSLFVCHDSFFLG